MILLPIYFLSGIIYNFLFSSNNDIPINNIPTTSVLDKSIGERKSGLFQEMEKIFTD